jgi:hypothetical protein
MNNDTGAWIGQEARIGNQGPAAERLDECDGGEDFLFRQWDHPDDAQEVCERILLRHPDIEERQLWRELAAFRRPAVVPWDSAPSVPMFLAEPRKLRDRVRLLIGRLPEESLRDFYGLVTLTQTFLARMEAVCDLLVYLYAEREKGTVSEGTPASLYVDFFAQKLNWELEELQHISQCHSLAEIPGRYVDWLTDRILDGEILI